MLISSYFFVFKDKFDYPEILMLFLFKRRLSQVPGTRPSPDAHLVFIESALLGSAGGLEEEVLAPREFL